MQRNKTIILRKLMSQNGCQWPNIERPYYLDKLSTLADKAFEQNKIETLISSAIIYHQLSEELIKIVIDCCDFYLQIRSLPLIYQPKRPKKMMFGSLVNELDKHISFKDKNKFLSQCNLLNSLRIEIVHKLTKATSIYQIRIKAKRSQKVYYRIQKYFDEIYDYFREAYSANTDSYT